ncbi:unnamed protein product, partial [marine sediment metagenome]
MGFIYQIREDDTLIHGPQLDALTGIVYNQNVGPTWTASPKWKLC